MALTHTSAVRTALADKIDDYVNTGAGTSKCQIATSSAFTTLLAEFDLSNPAFGAAVAGVITLASVPKTDSSANNTGTAANGRIIDRDGTEIVRGTVGTSGTDWIIDNVSIVSGQTVILNSLTWTAPA